MCGNLIDLGWLVAGTNASLIAQSDANRCLEIASTLHSDCPAVREGRREVIVLTTPADFSARCLLIAATCYLLFAGARLGQPRAPPYPYCKEGLSTLNHLYSVTIVFSSVLVLNKICGLSCTARYPVMAFTRVGDGSNRVQTGTRLDVHKAEAAASLFTHTVYTTPTRGSSHPARTLRSQHPCTCPPPPGPCTWQPEDA